MAKQKINKSELIRQYLKRNKKVGPTEAAAALTKQHGIPFTPTSVSNVRALTKAKKKKHGGADDAGAKRKTAGGPDGVGMNRPSDNGHPQGDIFAAMKLIRQAVEIIGAEMAKKAADLFSGK